MPDSQGSPVCRRKESPTEALEAATHSLEEPQSIQIPYISSLSQKVIVRAMLIDIVHLELLYLQGIPFKKAFLKKEKESPVDSPFWK